MVIQLVVYLTPDMPRISANIHPNQGESVHTIMVHSQGEGTIAQFIVSTLQQGFFPREGVSLSREPIDIVIVEVARETTIPAATNLDSEEGSVLYHPTGEAGGGVGRD